MQILDGRALVSASDLNNFLACRHLSYLDLARARGDLDEAPEQSETGKLLSRKGDEHELAYLEYLKGQGRSVIEVEGPEDHSAEALNEAAERTLAAMRQGPDVVYQAVLFDGTNRGYADFLFKIDRPSDLGAFGYEVADTKLARSPKPYFLIQLCFYSELLSKLQGGEPPERVHVILGDRTEQSFRLAEFAAYYRRFAERFREELDEGFPDTYPMPVQHCGICGWRDRCEQQRIADDHLSRVAGIRRDHVSVLEEQGIETLTALAELPPEAQVEGIRPATLGKVRAQAEIQHRGKESGPLYELLEAPGDRGFNRLPKPSAGDVFFDFEGDPLYGDAGLEYLWGYVLVDGGEPRFEYLWAADAAEERSAFERFLDFVTERRQRYPDLHIYHYAPYEVTALKRLAGQYGTREEELDALLREKVFVDLYRVVRESMRISEPSYSIKKVEAFYRGARDTAVVDGGESIIEFERWLDEPDEDAKKAIADAIVEYNRDDCLSTLECRDWLLERRQEAERVLGTEFAWFEPEAPEATQEAEGIATETEALIRRLAADVPEDPEERDRDQAARRLMAHLLDYHRREARPAWWRFFERLDFSDPDEFIDDGEAIGGLEPDPEVAPRQEKRSLVHRMNFPIQETKIREGEASDPATGKSAGTVTAIAVTEGWVELKRGPVLADVPLPHSLIPSGPYKTDCQRAALRRLAASILAEGTEPGPGRAHSACLDMLLAAEPRIAGRTPGSPVVADGTDLEGLTAVVAGLEESYLFVQGPPGAGKTYSASQVIVGLISQGRRVGVTANSHKAINNLLAAVEEAAAEREVRFKGLKKVTEAADAFESQLSDPLIESTRKREEMESPEVALVAGTAWHFCRDDVSAVDHLFIDEAGQISIADALALGTGARNVVLLGDPQQLAQVRQGRHPEGSGRSILEHLLGDHQTIPEERGVFLPRTWRLHPEVTEFVSELMYEGRLGSAPGRELQELRGCGRWSGKGLRWEPVQHAGRSQRSPEEAAKVAEIVGELLEEGCTYVDVEGQEHPLTLEDVLIVSPYNAQVQCLAESLPDGARVGTVDRFQGQEAQVVIFSMATSTGADIPRNIEFLFSRNRLNVAISRARCLAVLVASPELLNVEAKSVEQMRLVNALCRFVERA